MNSGDIESRKLKVYSQTGKENWVTEIGDVSIDVKSDNFIIKESTIKNVSLLITLVTQPIFIRLDSKSQFQFRIRNMPWEASNYQVEVDLGSDEIVVRTSNKKYFKRFCIPDLRRIKRKLDPSDLSVEYANSTLVISYTKPNEIPAEEKKIQLEIRRIKAEIQNDPSKKYDADCKNQ